MQTLREYREQQEEMLLSPYATRSAQSRGREREIPPCDVRTAFQRDRDRIVHCKSFRRLMHKTQVFLSPEDDHYRTRLTHTLEVTQIARTIARALRLNEDLTEAIAMGHDLGHTPFGHSGEIVLRECFDPSFTHYRQSLRVVEKLENNGQGLNLTWEVRDGIVNHTGSHLAQTPEGVIVKYADRIAYINHDIDDAIRANVLCDRDLPAHLIAVLGNSHGERINTLVKDVVFASAGKREISMSDEIGSAMEELRQFMFRSVYTNPFAKSEEERAKNLLADLYDYFVKNPGKLPEEYRADETESVERHVCDYIAGMTDRYAINLYTQIHIPKQFCALV